MRRSWLYSDQTLTFPKKAPIDLNEFFERRIQYAKDSKEFFR